MAARHMESAMSEVEYLILATPTGEDRNAITDANIHLMAAKAILTHLGLGKDGVPPVLLNTLEA